MEYKRFRPQTENSGLSIHRQWEFINISLFKNDFIFLEAERWGPRSVYNKKETRNYNTKLGIQGELTPAYLLDAIANNEKIGMEGMKHPNVVDGSDQLYENLNAWMEEIVHLPLRARVTEVDESTVKLLYNIEGSLGRSYSALQVGFGLTFCLPIVVALLKARKEIYLLLKTRKHTCILLRKPNWYAYLPRCA